jgi:O-methyltransferase/methyltransferase family protein
MQTVPGDKPARDIIDLVAGPWRAQTVYLAAKLGLADHLANRPLTAEALATEVGADPVSLRRFLRLLVGIGVFAGSDRDGYSLTESGNLLRTNVPGSMRDLAISYGELFFPAWVDPLPTAITGEQGFTRTYGKNLFEHLAEHPDQARTFDGAMAAGSAFFAEVPAVYDFSGVSTVVDIGGGRGALLAAILRAHPGVRGILYDADHVVEAAAPFLDEFADRCTRIGGDFTESVPPGADAYLLSRVLHDWTDEQCHPILRNIRDATAPGARLLIIERVIHDHPTFALEWDVQMMMVTGGRERTREEYAALLAPHAFRITDCLSLPLDVNILVSTREEQ